MGPDSRWHAGAQETQNPPGMMGVCSLTHVAWKSIMDTDNPPIHTQPPGGPDRRLSVLAVDSVGPAILSRTVGAPG